MNENTTKQATKINVKTDTIPDNCIWYESVNGEIVEPHDCSAFDANIVSNTYKDGKGIIAFDNDITEIGNKAFYECESLTSVAIPYCVTEISDWAFSSCIGLASVAISDSVTEIGIGAFCGCTMLKNVTIPDSVTAIYDSAFENCKDLKTVHSKPIMPPVVKKGWGLREIFNNIAPNAKIYVPRASVSAYKTAEGWKDYASRIEGYDFE